jgi:hypothetical protein
MYVYDLIAFLHGCWSQLVSDQNGLDLDSGCLGRSGLDNITII